MEHLRGSARPAAEEPTDGELLDRFVTDRDESAFVELVNRHGPLVLGVCRRLLDNTEDVEDAFQATFMVLVRKADTIRKRESAASWLYGVALRVARRARATLTGRRQRERRAALPEAIVPPEQAWDDVRPVLDDAVNSLPEKYRVLVILCYLQGRTYDEAARLLDLAKGTVSTRLTHARELLRQRLTRRGLVLPVALLVTLLEHNAAPAAMPPLLPPLAVEAGRSAAGMEGWVSPHVASLAKAAMMHRSITPAVVVALTLALVAIPITLVLWGKLRATDDAPIVAKPAEVWQSRFTLSNHRHMGWQLTFSPDGKTLATEDDTWTVRLWDPNNARQPLQEIASNDGFQIVLGFSADSRRVITAGQTAVHVFEVTTGKQIVQHKGSAMAKLAPDGNTLATIPFDEGGIHVIDLTTGRDRAFTEPRPIPVHCLAFSADSKRLGAGDGEGAIHLIDVATMERQGRLTGNAMPTLELAFSPDGTTLAAMHGIQEQPKRLVEVWELATEKPRELPEHAPLHVAFAPVGNVLVTQEGDGALNVWNPADGTRQGRFGGTMSGSMMFRIVFSADGTKVLTATNTRLVQIRDVATGQVRATLRGHMHLVADGAFAPDGRTLATGTITPEEFEGMPAKTEVGIWVRVE
jgi:RNA polymerase sigma factor (sigma-70 family)